MFYKAPLTNRVRFQRLAKLLSLPTFVDIIHASVRSLRLRLDINKGIDAVASVEVTGLQLRIRIRSVAPDGGKERDGGQQRSDRMGRHAETTDLFDASKPSRYRAAGARPIPSTQDLAESFVRSEPNEERIELQAAISQSVEQSDGPSYYGEEELGIGPDGGGSLPSFLAAYLKGLGERAKIAIKDLCLHFEFCGAVESAQNPMKTSDSVAEIVCRVNEITKQGLNENALPTTAEETSISVKGLSIALLSDLEDSAEPSQYARDISQYENQRLPIQRMPTQDVEESSHDTPTEEATDISLPASERSLRGFHSKQREGHQSPTMSTLSTTASNSDTSNGPQQPFASTPPLGLEDLTASRIFTHEEAESMYLSAMSTAEPSGTGSHHMPGAWDASFPFTSSESPNHGTVPSLSSSACASAAGRAQLPQHPQSVFDVPRPETVQRPSSREDVTGANKASTSDTSAASSVGKEMFNIDEIWLHIPLHVLSGANAADTKLSDTTRSPMEESKDGPQIEYQPDSLQHQIARLEVANVSVSLDLTRGRSLVSLAKKHLPAFQSSSDTSSNVAANPPLLSSFAFSVKTINLGYYENVPAFSFDLHSGTAKSEYIDALCSIRMGSIRGSSTKQPDASKQELQISKFSILYGSKELLRFDDSERLRESKRDIRSGLKDDIHILVTTSNGQNTVEISTLPACLMVDLPRFDDFLSRSGGLSTLLDLGSSFSSLANEKPPRFRERSAKGVHFEPRTVVDSSILSGPTTGKVNLRMQGLTVILSGTEAMLRAQTSAIKMVHRPEGAGLQVDRISLMGPFLPGQDSHPAVTLEVENSRIEYLQTPRESDLSWLLSIITPSQNRYDEDDDIMIDTLIRQRRKGAVLRGTVSRANGTIQNFDELKYLSLLVSEMNGLTTVAKYFPDDDRPGILTLIQIKQAALRCDCPGKIGILTTELQSLDFAHVSLPALVALTLARIDLHRNSTDDLLGEVVRIRDSKAPMLMCRFVSGELDPAVKVKLHNLRVEYSASTLIDLVGLEGTMTDEDMVANLTQSLIGLHEGSTIQQSSFSSPTSISSSGHADSWTQNLKVIVSIRECAVGLNPRGIPAKGALLLTKAEASGSVRTGETAKFSLDIGRASILVIDNVENLSRGQEQENIPVGAQQSTLMRLTNAGLVSVGTISSASILVRISDARDAERFVDVDVKDDLLVLESAADSTQTLLSIFNGLRPPMPVSQVAEYRTEVMPIQDMLESLTGDAFVSQPGPEQGLRASTASLSEAESEDDQREEEELEYVDDLFEEDEEQEDLLGFSAHGILGAQDSVRTERPSILRRSPSISSLPDTSSSSLEFHDDHFNHDVAVGGTAHRWDSRANTYGIGGRKGDRKYPLKIRIRDVHVIWNLFDGYDWQNTRDQITKAVHDVERQAQAKQTHHTGKSSPIIDFEDDAVVGDCLFNSIYIDIPPNRDPRQLTGDINKIIDDLASETGSYATSTTITQTTSRPHSRSGPKPKKLKLNRSRNHKITFELTSLNADFVLFEDRSSEIQSSIDIRVRDLDIFDHVPTSTWKKFATYMLDAGERETNTDMIHIEILNIKPVPDLAATEMVLKINVLPLRLHVDQDALDFMSRFFEFKDDSASQNSTQSNPPFLQRVEVNPVKVKLDFKPKRVDYGGLRSGRTTEFMNFFVLEQADMVLRRVILYGVSGFDRLGIMLNNVWMPDIRNNQLPGILAGIGGVRPLVNVGSGVRDLIVIPMREYRKDGRVVRSVQKGALSFAKTTTKELIKLGAKLAIGTQTVLQNTETLLGQPTGTGVGDFSDGEGDEAEPKKKLSLYADQPVGIAQGIRGAYASLERDLLLARDAIVAVPGEVMESGSASGAARAVLKRAPTVILRPTIGVSKAVSQTLLGAGNTLDKANLRRAEEVCSVP